MAMMHQLAFPRPGRGVGAEFPECLYDVLHHIQDSFLNFRYSGHVFDRLHRYTGTVSCVDIVRLMIAFIVSRSSYFHANVVGRYSLLRI